MATKKEPKIALITGANQGIGLEVARQLAKQDIHVLLGSRDENRGKTAVEQLENENLSVSLIQIDVTDQSTIDSAVNQVTNKYGYLDILINNSGIFVNEPRPSQLTIDMLEEHFRVNFYGAFLVTQAFLPLLKKSKSARIVNVSSALGSISFHQNNQQRYYHLAYSASKASLNMFTYQLSQELEKAHIKVNGCTPGLTATRLTNYRGHSVETGAKSIVYLATLDDNGPTGKYFNENCEEDQW